MVAVLKRFIAAALAAAGLLAAAGPASLGQAASPPPASGPGNPCPAGAPVRSYNIHAIQLDIVYNKFGQYQPGGVMYVLAENRDRVLAEVAANPGHTVSLVQPLAIRSNMGDCIEIEFRNELNEAASIHPTGVTYDVLGSDGMAAGYNLDSTAPPGGTVRYRWYPEREGTYFFTDAANQAVDSHPTGIRSLRQRGLFGALIVEPAGATWSDPHTGAPLPSGTKAVIQHPTRPDWRENVVFFHDGAPVINPDGTPAELYSLNYRAEPMGKRLTEGCPDCDTKALFYSSWVHGDPGGGDVVFEAYRHDPVVFHVIGAQVEEMHVFHLHANRWKSAPGDANSNTIDSLSISPGATYELWLDGGAGYQIGTVGDILFHCHFFPHYNEGGMWGMFRVFDKLQAGLLPLADRTLPESPTPEEPGFPHFIDGHHGHRPPKSPDPDLRPPTPVEQTALKAHLPGAPMVNPCPSNAPIRRYNITTIQREIIYNRSGDHDPKGRLYVLKEDAPAVLSGAQKPKPLTIRANQGDCVEVTFENDLPVDDTPNEMSIHIHYVAFDVLGSDGTAVGYNYDQGISPGQKIRYRWYADEQGPVYFHDHQSGSIKHGTFGSLIVEPPGSLWLDPVTGQPVRSGPEAVIVDPNGPDFRETALFYQDWVPLFDENGQPINPPHEVGGDEGTMGINYTNAPFWHRAHADPAHVFSSWVHGDPDTPIIQAYPGDPVKIRLISGSYEEPHNFLMHGVRWQTEPNDERSGDTAAQTITTSEYFNFGVQANPAGVLQRDYLYGSMSIDDLWNGMWGFFRVWGGQVANLQPLPDRGAPTLGISAEDLAKLTQTGTPPPTPLNPGTPCPVGAPLRLFDVVAFTHEVAHNGHGHHDPHGILFALAEHEQAIRNGTMQAEPLVIRANAGDCIQLTLRNKLPMTMDAHQDHAQVAVEHPWPNSNRISLHPQMLQYDVQGSDGSTVGYNFDQSVPPGGIMNYTWYADKELGATILWDMADLRSHRHHGAFGLLIVEPRGAEYRNPRTGEPLKAGAVADIILPDGEDFREFALLLTDGMYSVNPLGRCPTPPGEHDDPGTPCNQLGGAPEEQGAKGINYRAEPFGPRFEADARPEMVLSSHVHGDPATPLLRAYPGDPVRIRLAQPADKSPGMAFHLAGHLWNRYGSGSDRVTGVSEALTPGIATNLNLLGGAGGTQQKPGDYAYQEMKLVRYLEGGLWGLFRVEDQGAEDLKPLPDRRPTPPTGLSVTAPAGVWGMLDVAWDAHPSQDVVGYQVYRSLLPGGPYERITSAPVAGTSFRDTGLLNGTTYYYVATAVDRFGGESSRSAEASGRTRSALGFCLFQICLQGTAAVMVQPEEEGTADDGGVSAYSVTLTHQPEAEVVVALTPESKAGVNRTLLTFTPENWNVPQQVTLAAAEPGRGEGKGSTFIAHAVSSEDPNYDGITFRIPVRSGRHRPTK